MFEQTLNLKDGALANFSTIPAMCSTTSSPASTIVAMPSGAVLKAGTAPPVGTESVTLTCNLGPIGEGTAALLVEPTVWVASTSPNGSTYETTARVYGVSPEGTTTIQPSQEVSNGPINIVGEPRYDISKYAYATYLQKYEFDGAVVPGYETFFTVMISTDRKEGVEAPSQPINFTDIFWGERTATDAGGVNGSTVSDLKYKILSCVPASSVQGPANTVGGSYEAANPAKTVNDSGDCTFERQATDLTSPYDFTLSGIDTSGTHYPTQTLRGGSLAAGPYYVASYAIRVFVPLSEVDRASGSPSDGAGTLRIKNMVAGFDPAGMSGSSNFGDGFEPGYCRPEIPSSSTGIAPLPCDTANGATNNVAQTNITIGPGNWDKYVLNMPHAWVMGETRLTGQAGFHDGRATLQPGQAYGTRIRMSSTGAPIANPGMCDVIDIRTMQFTKLGDGVFATDDATYPAGDLYAYVLRNGLGVADQVTYQSNWKIQYAAVDTSGDVSNNGVFDGNDGRYGGSWTEQAAVNCGDPAIQWFDSPEEVPGGLNSANVVRAVGVDGYSIGSAEAAHFWVGTEPRNTYNGGANDGELIPVGTVLPDFASVNSAATWANWSSGRRYVPQPETSNIDGDRVSLTRAELAINKRTVIVDGVGSVSADIGQSKSTVAGRQIVWQMTPTLSALEATDVPVKDVTITDVLPAHVTYNDACTAALPGGTVPTSVTVNTDGTTTLVWALGDLIPNQPIANRLICTDTNPLAPNPTSLINNVEITSPDVAFIASRQRAQHTVTLEQDGRLQLRKDVDQTLDLQDQDQLYTLRLKNFSDSPVQAPTIIEVLSYNGDATNSAGVNRTPASTFAGTNTLSSAPQAFDFGGTASAAGTFYYTEIDPASVPQNANDDTDPSIWSTTFSSSATAFKFVASGPLSNASAGNASGLTIKYDTEQSGNQAGDLYSNRFTAFSPTFSSGGRLQLLTSNQTTVRVVGFSLGDFIWIDEDGDGVYTGGVDTPAPEGVTVEVFNESDQSMGTTTTNEFGRWVLNDLPTGKYYAVIPASEFAEGGLLSGLDVAPNPVADPNTDQNEIVDHHAITGNGGAVRSSGLVELSATVAGSMITGDEPLGDNVSGIAVSPLTTDGFTNLTVDLALVKVPGYEFTKTANPVTGTSVQAGDTITYTLTGTNTGATGLDVTITDDLTNVLAFADITTPPEADNGGTVTVDGNTLTFTGALAVDQSVKVTYTATVKEGMEGKTLTNTASSTAKPPYGPPITPPEVSTEHPVPGFEVTKSNEPGDGVAVAAGSSVTYTVTGSNTGATVLNPVVITDDLTQVLNNADFDAASLTATLSDGQTAPAAVFDAATQSLTWTGALEIGQSVTLTYTVNVHTDADQKNATLVNTVTGTATPPDGGDLTPPPVSTENPVPGYTFAKTSDPVTGSAVQPGDTITYTLTGTNTGATALDPVTITDDLTDVLAYSTLVEGSLVAAINGTPTAIAPTLDGTTLTWAGALAVGETITITYAVTVNDGMEGVVLHNRATSTATPPDVPTITPPPVETFHPTPGFTFIKSADPASGTLVEAGQTITYTLTGNNFGETVLDPVVITDDLSEVLSRADLVEGSLVATINGEPTVAPTLDGTTLTWTGVLQIGEVVSVTYQVVVKDLPASPENVIRNLATGSATPPGLPPITPPPVVTEHPIPAMSLVKSSDPASGSTVQVGESVSYTVTASNAGAADIIDARVTDDLSGVLHAAELTVAPVATIVDTDGVSRDGGTVTREGDVLSWQGALAVGERVEITYTVKVTTYDTKLRNVATLAWPGDHPEVPPATTEHPVPPAPVPPVTPTPPLTVTGTDAPIAMALLALLVMLAGGTLLIARRRRAV